MSFDGGILKTIGNTPLIPLRKMSRGLDAEIWVKLEYMNPSGSMKDRVALRMIRDAEREGLLRPGMEIVESTTGNMGASLAFMGAVLGHPITLYVPGGLVSEERKRILEAYGANIVPIDIDEIIRDGKLPKGIHGAIVERVPRFACAKREREDKNVWWARQFGNPSNEMAHKDGTGREIVEQMNGKIDAFVMALGTGGTLLGVTDAFAEANIKPRVIAVEPEGHPTIIDGKLSFEEMEGISGGLLKDIVDRKAADEMFHIKDEEAVETAHQLALEEGLFCGMSSGANVYAALQVAKKLKKGQRVVTILVDNRYRYLFNERFTT